MLNKKETIIDKIVDKMVRTENEGKISAILKYKEVAKIAKENNVDYYELLKELDERGFAFK